MSGVRSYSFREGDRSEYLAQFLLSAIGLCTPIPRQEDIGLDFACSIADQESGLLSFGYPYLVSTKSISSPSIKIEPSKTAIAVGDSSHVGWLWRQEQPILLGVVDKANISLRLYSLLPLWFLYYKGGPTIGSLSLTPRIDPNDLDDVGRPAQGKELSEWPGHFHFDVDLGQPIAILDIPTIQDESKTRKLKTRLRKVIKLAQQSLLHYQLGIPHFYWIARASADGENLQPAVYFDAVPPSEGARQSIMAELVPSLISFALHSKEIGNDELLNSCVSLLRHAKPESIPPMILDHFPQLRSEALNSI